MQTFNLPMPEELEQLMKNVEEMKVVLSVICNNMPTTKVVTVADICKIEHVSKTQISTKEAYLLPNFGISEYPEGTKRWNLSTYLKWREIPASKRKDMYVDYLEAQRRAYVQRSNVI